MSVNDVKEFLKSEEAKEVGTGFVPLATSLMGTWVVKRSLNKLAEDPPVPGQVTFLQARRVVNLVAWAGYYVAVNGYYGVRLAQKASEASEKQKKRNKDREQFADALKKVVEDLKKEKAPSAPPRKTRPTPKTDPLRGGQAAGRSEGFSFE